MLVDATGLAEGDRIDYAGHFFTEANKNRGPLWKYSAAGINKMPPTTQPAIAKQWDPTGASSQTGIKDMSVHKESTHIINDKVIFGFFIQLHAQGINRHGCGVIRHPNAEVDKHYRVLIGKAEHAKTLIFSNPMPPHSMQQSANTVQQFAPVGVRKAPPLPPALDP